MEEQPREVEQTIDSLDEESFRADGEVLDENTAVKREIGQTTLKMTEGELAEAIEKATIEAENPHEANEILASGRGNVEG
ncbi:hypothetical protein IJ090_01725 [Candidatus Saccharibacteria bacterium]|nr:hypothetical protein [Candidatus Saccharibacteria bacterium]